MVGDETYIGWKERLILFGNASSDVGPPQGLQFKHRTPAMQAHTMHAFHPNHRVAVAAPKSDRSVWMVLDLGRHRHESRRPMMLRPIELHAAGYPGLG
jgi:hypothetical protein